MSGEKRAYVSVEEAELRRLRERDTRLRGIQRDLPQRLEEIRREANQAMQGRMRPIEDRLKQSEGMVKGLKSDLVRTEGEIQRRIQSQQRDFRVRMESQRGEYRSLIESQGKRMGAALSSERQARQKSVDNLQGQIHKIVADTARKTDIAASFVSDLSKIVAETRRMPHDRFAPGRLQAIDRHVQDAKDTARLMPEASLSTAQRAYWDLVDLRDEVLFKEREFMLIYQAALAEARSILEEARANRKYALEIGEGQNMTSLDLEVDHWTRGELSAFEEEVRAIERDLSAGSKTLSTEEVKQALGRMDAMKPRIGEIVEKARQNILSSQLRYNIAEVATQALTSQGFSVQDSTYEGQDERNAFVVKVRNVAGSEVVTVIAPVENEMGKNEISINSYDATFMDENTLQTRAGDMAATMKDAGLQVGVPEHVGDASPLYRDMEAVRVRKSVEHRI